MSIKIRKEYLTDGKTDASKLKAGGKKLISRAGKWRTDVQHFGIACLLHAQEFGDWTPLRDYQQDLTKTNGVNKTAFGKWASFYMHATLEDVSGEMKFLFADGKGVKDIDVEGAAKVMWYEYKDAPKDTSKDLDEIRTALAKMLTASIKTEKVTVGEAEALIASYDATVEGFTQEEVEKLQAAA